MTKNFDDFLKTLTEEDFVNLAKKVNALELTAKISNDPHGFNDFLTKLSSSNIVMVLELLRKYHDWLNS